MSEALAAARAAFKAGDLGAGRATLQAALKAGMDPGETERAGRLLLKHPSGGLRVRVLGVCTTAWIPPSLTAVAWGQGVALRVSDGDYDSVLQELSRGEPADVVVLLPWTQRLLAGEDADAAIAAELGFWEAAWGALGGARLVQVGYDWTHAGPLGASLSGGPGGPIARIRAMNAALRARLPAGAAWVDLELVSGELGRRRFYEPRRYYWTKQPFSDEGLLDLCQHLFAAIRATTTGPRKLVVTDLDNTLWGGVVGELGPQQIAVRESPEGEAHRALQQHLLGLSRRGVLLAVCSKNNLRDALEPFETNPDMVLKREHFAAFEASWDPKPQAIARIAETLRLGLDSFVFLDDNPAEREAVRQALPEVAVVELPADPAGYVAALEAGLWFEAVALTRADLDRAQQYQVEAERRDDAARFASLDDYLASLDMVAHTRRLDEDDLERVVQLLGKTNQFNLTTRRHPTDVVRGFMDDARAVALTVRLRDRFGDHGLVAVVLGAPGADGALDIDSWLMSCRVIGRTLEQHTLRELARAAAALGYRALNGLYLPTAKNEQVADLFERLGFTRTGDTPEGGSTWTLSLTPPPEPVTWVREG